MSSITVCKCSWAESFTNIFVSVLFDSLTRGLCLSIMFLTYCYRCWNITSESEHCINVSHKQTNREDGEIFETIFFCLLKEERRRKKKHVNCDDPFEKTNGICIHIYSTIRSLPFSSFPRPPFSSATNYTALHLASCQLNCSVSIVSSSTTSEIQRYI